MPSLNELIGYTVTVHSESLNSDHPARVKLHGVEVGGLWIESKELTEASSSRNSCCCGRVHTRRRSLDSPQ
jgi:hypothetical protein